MSSLSIIWETFTRDNACGADLSYLTMGPVVNPATGLPMQGEDCAGVDVGGSPYGVDVHAQFSNHDFDMGGSTDGF